MQFTTTTTSVVCACGGRHNNVPDIRRRHMETYKHMTWVFQSLCEEFLSMSSQQEKVRQLLRMRDVMRTGKVK
jgi:hypothetical protein